MNSLVSETAEHTVPAKVRYINAEWKGKDDSPRIGSRESRRANTSFQDVRVHNARPRLEAGELTLDKNGFTLTQHHSAVTDFRDDNELERVYHKEMEALICRVTGADHCFARSHLIRTEKPIDFNDGYARFVHCDYNMKRLQEMSETVLETHGVEPQKNWFTFGTTLGSPSTIRSKTTRLPLSIGRACRSTTSSTTTIRAGTTTAWSPPQFTAKRTNGAISRV